MRPTGRALSVFLSIVLVVGLMPLPAFAGDGSLQVADIQSLFASGVAPAAINVSSYNNDPASILDGKDQKAAYAVLYDDGEMLMQRGNTNKRSDIGVTAVYTGLESGYWDMVEIANNSFTKREQGCSAYTRKGVFNRDWGEEGYLVKSVKVMDKIKPKNMTSWYCGFSSLESADLLKLDTSAVVRMDSLFDECSMLEDVDLSSFDTRNVVNMSSMFSGCSSIESLDLSSFKTPKLSDIGLMFWDCPMLKYLDISGFSTESMAGNQSPFFSCDRLECVILGSGYGGKFSLPRPDKGFILGANGKWYDGAGNAYDGSRIPRGVAGTYYSYQPGYSIDRSSELTGSDSAGAYGVLYRDGTLLFQRGNARNDEMFTAGNAVIHYFAISEDGPSWSWSRDNEYYSNIIDDYKNFVSKVVFTGTLRPETMRCWFSGCEYLKSVDFGDLDTSHLSDAAYLFGNCKRIKSLDMSGLDMSDVVDASCMFCGCSSLQTIGIDSLDLPNAQNLSYLFSGAPLASSIDFSKMNTPSATNMAGMFCRSGIERFRLADLDTSKVTSMNSMFAGCTKLKALDLSDVDTSSLTDMGQMFTGCSSLEVLDLSEFETARVTNVCEGSSFVYPGGLFGGCERLKSLDLSGLDVSRVTSLDDMFKECVSLEHLDLSGIETSSATSMSEMFRSCYSLKELDVSGFDTSHVTDMSDMFCYCESLTELDVSGFNVENVEYLTHPVGAQWGIFGWCSSLKRLDLSNFHTKKAVSMASMFWGSSSLEEIDLSGLDTSQVTEMNEMFAGCSSLKEVDFSGFNTSRVTNMGAMFSGCSSLASLDLTSFDTSNVENIAGMFQGCTLLESVDMAGFDTSDISKYVYVSGEEREADEMSVQSVASGSRSLSTQSVAKTQSTSYSTVFKNCPKLRKVTVGEDFAFKHKTLLLPAQSASKISGADGKWHTAAGAGYVPAKVPSNKAATYYAYAPLSQATVTNVWNMPYTGKEATQSLVVKLGSSTLKKDVDYKLSYKNNVKVGTATVIITGVGSRIGSKKATFKITAANKSLAKTKVTGAKGKVYTGKAQTQALSVKLGSATLKSGRDYKVTYEGNVNAGIAKAIVHGVGAYSGSKAVKFAIAKAANPMNVVAKAPAVSYNKSKAVVVKAANAYNFKKKAVGTVTYARVAKGSSKWLAVNSKTGNITVKAGAPKGKVQAVVVKLTAKGNANYKAASKTLTVKVKVK